MRERFTIKDREMVGPKKGIVTVDKAMAVENSDTLEAISEADKLYSNQEASDFRDHSGGFPVPNTIIVRS